MEPPHISPSSYPVQSPEDSSGFPGYKEPLSDSTGNILPHDLHSASLYDGKALLPNRQTTPMFGNSAIPSQARNLLVNPLVDRRQNRRRARQLRYTVNPITESSQYKAYRDRQNQGNSDDQKWPAELEASFLDALIDLPPMGRRKYTYDNKPHGRNELIAVYLWIAYTESLPPGAVPDENMRRSRKQVSSHIQVLKGFMRGHPAVNRLFPPKEDPKNGFEDSFKNDPCLKAISKGRLPNKRYVDYSKYDDDSARHDDPDQDVRMNHQPSLRPVVFSLFMSSPSSKGSSLKSDSNQELQDQELESGKVVTHRFSNLSTQIQNSNLESIRGWRQRFPWLYRLQSSNRIDCDIIHMQVSLNLLTSLPVKGAELLSRVVLSIPGPQPDDSEWRIATTLIKPPELYGDRSIDPPVYGETVKAKAHTISQAETHITVPYPANSWAQAFCCLYAIQAEHLEQQKTHSSGSASSSVTLPTHRYLEQIFMYQEVFSNAGSESAFSQRVIILWTFQQAADGAGNKTNWCYLDASPPHQPCVSPSPHHASYRVSVAYYHDHPSTFLGTPICPSQQNLVNTHGHTMGSSSSPSPGSESPSAAPHYSYVNQGFELPSESLGFQSQATGNSESKFADNDGATGIENIFTQNHDNLREYNHHPATWSPFETDTDAVWAHYQVPMITPTIAWNGPNSKASYAWGDLPMSKALEWVSEKPDWCHMLAQDDAPKKAAGEYVEASIEKKLMPWMQRYVGGGEVAEPAGDDHANMTAMVKLELGNWYQPISPKTESWDCAREPREEGWSPDDGWLANAAN